MEQHLLRAGIPGWYVESMKKIHYLFPKVHAVHYAKTAAILAWFKVYYLTAFYHVSLVNMNAGELFQYSDDVLIEKRSALAKESSGKETNPEVIDLLLEARRRNIPLRDDADFCAMSHF